MISILGIYIWNRYICGTQIHVISIQLKKADPVKIPNPEMFPTSLKYYPNILSTIHIEVSWKYFPNKLPGSTKHTEILRVEAAFRCLWYMPIWICEFGARIDLKSWFVDGSIYWVSDLPRIECFIVNICKHRLRSGSFGSSILSDIAWHPGCCRGTRNHAVDFCPDARRRALCAAKYSSGAEAAR